ncbi:MAG: hypothetical protein PSN34_06400 [Urechidicola sp.]|nr:hypothetical protein [Urechidicola sp.]
MNELEEKLIEYVEWLSQKNDVFYAFDNPKKAAKEFLSQNQ